MLSVWPGIDPGYCRLPQSKIIMCKFIGVMLSCEKNRKFLVGEPGLSVMTLREGRVDRLFPGHVIR
jgi:hypothetical protein